MKHIITTGAIAVMLAGCTTMGDVEKQALQDGAIQNARNQGKEVHLAYLQCYALRDIDKKDCKRKAKNLAKNRQDARTWEYILPFDYEAERLGFKAFLQNKGKSCSGVDQGPKYNKERNAYDVICTDGKQYGMRFDSKKTEWKLAE
jgi:hypothetical protein